MPSISQVGLLGHVVMLVLVIVIAVAVAIGSVLIADRILDESVGPQHNSTLSPFLTVVGLVFGALLGFTVVVSWEQFSSAKANVAHEASTLTTMYRQTVAMPDPERSQLRGQLRTYATAAASQDWQSGDSNALGADARPAISEMYRLVGGAPDASSNPVNSQFLSQLTVLANDRNQRVLDAEARIPAVLWGGLIFGGVVLVALTGFMRLNHNVGHMILSSAIAILLGLLLFIIYWLDHPLGVDVGVTPKPFQQALQVFDLIDQNK
jgi:Na+/proline symporter